MTNSCAVQGCDRIVKYAGLCGMHYKRKWRHGDVNYADYRNVPVNLNKCLAEGCEERGATKGYCNVHYNRVHRYGRTYTIINDKGVGGIDSNGYYVITVNGKRVYEHIHIAEKALGRPLPKGAVVHHMNRVKHDNETPFNLVICPDQAYHLLLHRRAKELGYEDN